MFGQPNVAGFDQDRPKQVAGSAESCPADFPSTSPFGPGNFTDNSRHRTSATTQQVGYHIMYL